MAEYFFGITDKGKRREKNEDAFIALELVKKELVAACVIDGVGGYSGGEVAASITRNVILKQLQNLELDIKESLQAAIVAANTKILEEKKKNNTNGQMACVVTCVVADIKNNKLYYAHVGDTRLYLLRDHSLVKLSKDHSVIGFLEESGRLSERDAMTHPRRNEITKALGFEENINGIKDFIEMGESPFLPGDIILVCSDGLSDMIYSNTILEILLKKNGLEKKATELIAAANDAGGNDNITTVLVQNNNQPVPKVALKPDERKKNAEQDGNTEVVPAKSTEKTVNRKRSFIVLLSVVSIGLLAMVLFQKDTRVKGNNIILNTEAAKPSKNENLDLFIRSVIDSARTYTFSQRETLLDLTEPVLINKDSFYIKGNGVTISSDSNYKGPAFIINKTSKQVILDSITFKNFDVAIIVQKNNIVFKNVRFINCQVPVQYQLSFPDTAVSGRIKDSIFIPLLPLKKTK